MPARTFRRPAGYPTPAERVAGHVARTAAPPCPINVTFESIVPVRNRHALGAYYCGLFSGFPFLGLPLGLIGIVQGIKGLRLNARYPEVKGKTHAWVGIIAGILGILVNVSGSVIITVDALRNMPH